MRDVEDQSKSFVHQLRNDMSWEDILWIKQNTSLKIILKGVTSPEDVELAHKYGADAIWISNHGGRQLDTCPATILVLPAIRRKIIGILTAR
jgi:isopentenyl diphosphate isomerase/L-lactate dehydrogenase-like FMN-dependent dehydrogenase